MDPNAFTPEEISRLRRLLEEDEIRNLRNLYSHYMDASQIDELAGLFTEDAVCEFGPHFGSWHGREEIRRNFAGVDAGTHQGASFFAMHCATNHWVEVQGPNRAIGRAYLLDVVTQRAAKDGPIQLMAIYDEVYRKEAQQWRIERCALQFMWPARSTTEGFVEALPKRS